MKRFLFIIALAWAIGAAYYQGRHDQGVIDDHALWVLDSINSLAPVVPMHPVWPEADSRRRS